MVCQQCGSPVEGAFCSRCGVRVQAGQVPEPNAGGNPGGVPGAASGAYPGPYPPYAVPPFYRPRVRTHLQTLGILWIVYGAYRALGGLFGGLFLIGMSRPGFFGNWGGWSGEGAWNHGFPFFGGPFMAGIGTFVVVVSLIMGALACLVGLSLMNRKPWGRTLAIIMGILSLIKIPLGTAIGIYTLWVLAPAASGAEYDQLAAG